MLVSLAIKNYALIDNLRVNFHDGFSIITGETGAGKSILLGGLALVLGKRADASLVNNKEAKCIIEAEFSIDNYNLKTFFEKEDLDYESITTIRREILPSGKSRAFINDTPTTLTTLKNLSEQLVDIHSQHETLQLADSDFQFKIIDALAKNEAYVASYAKGLKQYKKLIKELDIVLASRQQAQNEYDYNVFLLNELVEIDLKADEQSELEASLEKLSHVEEIKLNLSEAIQISDAEQVGLINQLNQVKANTDKIANYASHYKELAERVHSILIELTDVVQEFESENEGLAYNPSELEKVENRLQSIYDLQKKHAVDSIPALLGVLSKYQNKVDTVESAEEEIISKKEAIKQVVEKLENLALKLHERRKKAIPVFRKQMETILSNLEMINTRFSINLLPSKELLSNGKDQLEFLISANKGISFERLKKAASGGEMSRIMLAVKSIMSKYTKLPTIVFDEIDTGVSGEVSNRIAEVMQQMCDNMQVITITHLPQVAAKGNQHYKVYKKEINGNIHSDIKILDMEERTVELAEMLGGKQITDSALAHAKQLLL